MRHPCATAPVSRRPSLLSTRLTTPKPHAPPLCDKRTWIDPPPPVPPLPSWLDVTPNRTPSLKSNKSGHYIKHSSKLTLLLSGQREGVTIPQYSNGDTIEGILAIARPSGILALDVRVEGMINVQEIGGSGSVNVKSIDDTIYSWKATRNGSFPPRASFCYSLPSTYLDHTSNKRYLLPPTYSEDLQGIPGFSVKAVYAIVVNLTLSRDASALWRGMSSIKVPFHYVHRTRPLLAGPFPCNPQSLPSRPRTMFAFQMRSWRRNSPSIVVHLYLPASAVCCYREPIPFHITLFADELTLEPFSEYRPRSTSFLPHSPASNTSSETLHNQLASRRGTPKCPLRIRVQRTTTVDTGDAGSCCSVSTVRQKGSVVRQTERSPNDRSHMYTARALGHGEVHTASRGVDSLVWTGTIVIPPSADGFSEAFDVSALKVVDSVVLAIDPPPACRSRYLPLNESVTLHLTSDPHKSKTGPPVYCAV